MDDLLQNLNVSRHDVIERDVYLIRDIAQMFRNMSDESDESKFFIYLGQELETYYNRLHGKLEKVDLLLNKLQSYYMIEPDENSEINNIIKSLKSEINVNREIDRAESNLNQDFHGYLSICTKSLNSKIGSEKNSLFLYWENCLAKANGKLQSALRSFFNGLEENSGELSSEVMKIVSLLDEKTFDEKESKDRIQALGNYSNNIKEYNNLNLKAAETAIALTMYLTGDERIVTNPSIVHIIQEKHMNFLKNI